MQRRGAKFCSISIRYWTCIKCFRLCSKGLDWFDLCRKLLFLSWPLKTMANSWTVQLRAMSNPQVHFFDLDLENLTSEIQFKTSLTSSLTRWLKMTKGILFLFHGSEFSQLDRYGVYQRGTPRLLWEAAFDKPILDPRWVGTSDLCLFYHHRIHFHWFVSTAGALVVITV